MRNRWKYTSAILAILIAALALLQAGSGLRREESQTFGTSSLLDKVTAAQVTEAFQSVPSTLAATHPVGGILSHHLTARVLIAQLVQALREAKPKTIVVIGPDHTNTGPTYVTTSAQDWESSGRRFSVDRRTVDALRSLEFVHANEQVISEEHSVLVPLPFLKEQFPDARFVLLEVHSTFDFPLINKLADRLNAVLGPDDLVIASVDFSHYQNLTTAEEEDAGSSSLLLQGDPSALRSIKADSPAALALTMRFAQLRKAPHLTLLSHQNSALLIGDPSIESTTSYFTGYFTSR